MRLLLSALAVPWLAGHALAALNCTVAAPALTKRVCESDKCATFGVVTAGETVHAACRADCSTDDEPWLKLYDGSYVRATPETVGGCRSFCQPYSVLGLPRCNEATGSASASACAHSALVSRQNKPLGAPPPPSYAVAAKCGIALSGPSPLSKRLARMLPRFTFSNATLAARGLSNSTATAPAGVFPRAQLTNVTMSSRAAQEAGIVPRGVLVNSTATLPVRMVRRETRGLLNETVAATTRMQVREEKAKGVVVAIGFSNATFVPTKTRRGPAVVRPLRFWA